MMRRFDESAKDDFKKAIRIGQDNAECLQGMQHWCKHVELTPESSGLYAQMTKLPIGSYRIGCPKVEGFYESMNLRWLFSDFLVQNCANCSHHVPNGDVAWGQEIIDCYRKKAHKQEQEIEQGIARISKIRSDLRAQSKAITADSEPESYRILEFLETVFSEDEAQRNEAIGCLKQSAHLGSDLFPDTAIDLILELASSKEFSESILTVCTILASQRPELAPRFSQKALENIAKRLNPELSASVLHSMGESFAYPLDEVYIEGLLLSQTHTHPFGGWFTEEHDYSNSTNVLIRSFDAKPDSVQHVIRRELQNENSYVRTQLCGAISLIQRERPQIALNLLDDLIQSLEIYERRDKVSPSEHIVRILQAAFKYSAEKVDQFLAKSIIRVRPTVQEDLIRVYQEQFFDSTTGAEERCEHSSCSKVYDKEKVAIQRLLTWAKDENIEIDIRKEIVETLQIACNKSTTVMLSKFDSLLGYFALVSAQKSPPAPPIKILRLDQPVDSRVEQLDEYRREQDWRTFKWKLQECLKSLCKSRSSKVIASVCGCLENASSKLDEDFKACCVSLLGEIGKDYRLQQRVLPLIWRGLMDYESVQVRSSAIRATCEMFSYSKVNPPANLVDALILHLQDPVHKAALDVISRHSIWLNESQSIQVLRCLAAHIHAYRDDEFQLKSICQGILAISRQDERLKLYGLRMVESVFPTGNEYVDADIATELIRFCEPSEDISQFIAKDVGTYLGLYERDKYNGYGFSEREHMFRWLHTLTPTTFQLIADDLLISANKLAERDALEACQFAHLFAYFRAFQYEHTVLTTAANALPDEPRYAEFRAHLKQLATVATGNAALQAGDIEAAKACFTKSIGAD